MRRDGVGEPSGDHTGDLQIVIFQHHHVPVAVNAVLTQPQCGNLDAGLRQILGRAVVVSRMIGSLGGDDDCRNIGKVRKTPRRRLLLPAEDEVRAVGLGLLLGLQLGSLIGGS